MRLLIYGMNPRMESGMGKVGVEMGQALADEHDVHYFAPSESGGPPREFPPGDDRSFTLHGCAGGGAGRGHFPRKLAEVDPDMVVTNRNWQSITWLDDVLNNRYMNSGQATPLFIYGPPIEAVAKPPFFEQQLLGDHLNDVYMVPYTGDQAEAMVEWGLGEYLLLGDDGPRYVPHGIDHDVFRPDAKTVDPNIDPSYEDGDTDGEYFRKKLGLDDRFVVGVVCENWRRKNLDLLMDGFAEFKAGLSPEADLNSNPILMLHTSPGPSRGDDEFYAGWKLGPTADAYGLTAAASEQYVNDETDVFWTREHAADYQPREYVASFLSACDLYCLPTSGESFSMTTLEAHACETPVLQTDIETLRWVSGGAAEYIEPVQRHAINSGELMETPSVPSIAASLRELHDDDEKRERMVMLGRERANQFSWERFQTEILAAVERAAAEAE